MRYFIPLLALGCTACAPHLTMANEMGGTINQSGSMGNDRAFAMAEEHCAKFGKSARVVDKTILVKSMRFECLAH